MSLHPGRSPHVFSFLFSLLTLLLFSPFELWSKQDHYYLWKNMGYQTHLWAVTRQFVSEAAYVPTAVIFARHRGNLLLTASIPAGGAIAGRHLICAPRRSLPHDPWEEG
jgi:hypothetical protein